MTCCPWSQKIWKHYLRCGIRWYTRRHLLYKKFRKSAFSRHVIQACEQSRTWTPLGSSSRSCGSWSSRRLITGFFKYVFIFFFGFVHSCYHLSWHHDIFVAILAQAIPVQELQSAAADSLLRPPAVQQFHGASQQQPVAPFPSSSLWGPVPPIAWRHFACCSRVSCESIMRRTPGYSSAALSRLPRGRGEIGRRTRT